MAIYSESGCIHLERKNDKMKTAMANSISARRIDELRASILAQRIQREYLETLVEKAKLFESQFGSDYPRKISKAFQDIVTKITIGGDIIEEKKYPS